MSKTILKPLFEATPIKRTPVNQIEDFEASSEKRKRYRLDAWLKRNMDNMIAQIKAYIVAKYGDFAYDSRPAKRVLCEFLWLLEEECTFHKYGREMVFEEDGVFIIRIEKIVLGECFHFLSPHSSEEFESKPYLDFLYEMKWLNRERYLLEKPYEDPDDEEAPDYELRKGEKFYYFYGINHEQLKANFCDRLASERDYDMCKLDKLLNPE